MLAPRILKKLEEILGKERIIEDWEGRLTYSYDAQVEEAVPAAVVFPQSDEEIAQIMKLAYEEEFYVVPRGAGTGLSGGSVPLNNAIVMSFEKMNKILEINGEDLYAVAQPGVITLDFQNEVEKKGLFYPPDPASAKASTLGGNIAENAGGLRGFKYGVTRDYVLSLKAISPQGEQLKLGAKTIKSVSGYDLVGLFCGSEGTLGIVYESTLKLLPLPEAWSAMLLVFSTLDEAASAVSQIIAQGIVPSSLELMDNFTIKAVEDYKHLGLPRDAGAIVILEVDGYKESVEREMAKIEALLTKMKPKEVKKAKDQKERDDVWAGRRSALAALARISPTTLLEDVTVPRSRLSQMVHVIEDIAKRYNLRIGTFGHAGDGNLHPTFLTDWRNKDEWERVQMAIEELFTSAVELGGTLSGEHGIGLAKAPFLPREYNEATIEAMKSIKRALDPKGLLNPGKIFID
ncbi:FAD-binding protein [bacterium]|nr:FAD-binding protein [bacterium]